MSQAISITPGSSARAAERPPTPASFPQYVPAELPGGVWDVAIIGAGPAGSVAAVRLASRGVRVLMIDRRRFPRDKACGDALIGDAIQCLRRNGLYDRVARLAWATRTLTAYSPSQIAVDVGAEFLTLKRSVLDAELVAAAAARGVTVCYGTVSRVAEERPGIVRVELSGAAPVRARLAMIATGADTSLLRAEGMLTRPQPSGIAIRAYIRSAVELDRLVISFDRSIIPGYAWIFPLGGGEYNVGCGVFQGGADGGGRMLRELLDRFLGEFPLARELRARATNEGPVRGALLRCGLTGARPDNGGRVLAIGETIGTTFRFTGEGIGKAMESGELAADVVHSALENGARRLSDYTDRLGRELRPHYRGYEVAERWLSRAWLGNLLAWRARRSPFLRGVMADIVSGTADPREAFSLAGLVRSLVR